MLLPTFNCALYRKLFKNLWCIFVHLYVLLVVLLQRNAYMSLIKKILCVYLISSIHVFSQGNFIEKDKDAFGVGVVFSSFDGGQPSSDGGSTIVGSVGYALLGRYEISLSYGKHTLSGLGSAKDRTFTSLSPTVQVIPIKQGTKFPLSMGLGIGILHLSADNSKNVLVYEAFTSHKRGLNVLVYEAFASHKRGLTNVFSLQPTGSIVILNEARESEYEMGFGLGLNLIFDFLSKIKFVISPALSSVDSETSYSIGTAFIFTTN